jgi:hypothetical protein
VLPFRVSLRSELVSDVFGRVYVVENSGGEIEASGISVDESTTTIRSA